MQARDSISDVPAVFISHGSPMVAVEAGPYQDALASFGAAMRPSAIVAVSAHWDSSSMLAVSVAQQYKAVHDFGGFPRSLYQLTYSPPGSPEIAKRIVDRLTSAGVSRALVENAGLDHGLWIPLRLMYPEASVPVVQLSLPACFRPQQLVEVGRLLAPLRSEDVLVMGSGGIVHNLSRFSGGPADQPVESWAREFDEWFTSKLEEGDLESLTRYKELAPFAEIAVPTFEHLAPVFIVLGAAPQYRRVETIFAGFQYGSISMRSFAIA